MARDYKRSARRSRRKKEQPGWMWMLGGLGIGLAVALAVYIFDRLPAPTEAQPRPAADALPSSSREPPAETADTGEQRGDYDFYEVLPRFELVIPERERDVRPDAGGARTEKPGRYVLQAGSFQRFADADRMKANLALLGLESRIQRVTIDNDQTWHRVRIGPVEDLEELDRLRRRLRESKIEVLVIRVGE